MQARTFQDIATVRTPRKQQPIQPVQSVKRTKPAPSAQRRHAAPARTKTLARSGAVRPKVRRRRVVFKRMRRTVLLYAPAVLIFAFGLYVGISGLYANKEVQGQVQGLQEAAGSEGSGSTGDVPPSTEKPSAYSIANYKVAPANPRYIDIPSQGIHARVLSMSVDENNELEAPRGIHDAGWYNASSKPGEAGAMLVDGHSGIGDTNGIFHYLHDLKAGERIIITRGDGKQFTYKVVESQIVDADKVNMASLLVSKDTTKPGLSLITCTGDWIPGTFSLEQRAVVYAVME